MVSLQHKILKALESKDIDASIAIFLLEQMNHPSHSVTKPEIPIAPGSCSLCHGSMEVVKMRCTQCGATLEGQFKPCLLNNLTAKEQELLHLFLKTHGNLKEMERSLKVSYPTVRNRVELMIQKIIQQPQPSEDLTLDDMKNGVANGMFSVEDALDWFIYKKNAL